jgi:hypothetical protein
MTSNYNEYLEQIKKKLDALNKAAGVNPQENMKIQNPSNNGMPGNDIFDMLGNGAKIWMQRNNNSE